MSGMPFDDAAKSRLAKSIISGKDSDPSQPSHAGPLAKAQDKANEQFEGEHDGHIRIRNAENGVMIEHDRFVPRLAKSGGSKGDAVSPSSSGPDHERRTHAKIFKANDHEAMGQHMAAIARSPMRKDGGY